MRVLCTAQMGISTVMGQTMRVVAIAKALQRRGHDVCFIAYGKLVPVIKEFGINVIEADDMPQVEVYAGDRKDFTMPPGEETLAKIRESMGTIARIETETAKRERPDIIVSGTLSGAQVARQLGIPSMVVLLQPHGANTVNMFSRRIKGADEREAEKMMDKIRSLLEAARIIILEGMPEISGGITFEHFGRALTDIKGKIRFTGPLLTDYPDHLPERGELKKAHCGDDSKLMVYVTIGGGSMLIGESFLKTVLEALKLLPEITGVIATGISIPPETIEKYRPPGNAIVKGFVPGTEMVKASDVTIFHGGSSTLMTCIACGTPAVVVPSMGEQADNGAVLAQHGAGIVLEKQTVTAGILAEAIQKIIGCASYRANAQQLKRLGEKYGGAEAAADWAEELARGAAK